MSIEKQLRLKSRKSRKLKKQLKKALKGSL